MQSDLCTVLQWTQQTEIHMKVLWLWLNGLYFLVLPLDPGTSGYLMRAEIVTDDHKWLHHSTYFCWFNYALFLPKLFVYKTLLPSNTFTVFSVLLLQNHGFESPLPSFAHIDQSTLDPKSSILPNVVYEIPLYLYRHSTGKVDTSFIRTMGPFEILHVTLAAVSYELRSAYLSCQNTWLYFSV